MIDQQATNQLAERVFTDINGAMTSMTLYLGLRLGLFRALADAGPSTPDALARTTGLDARYLREWLGCMAAADYLEWEPDSGRFRVSPEQVAVFLDGEHPAHALPMVGFVPAIASVLPALMDAFRDGGGVPFEAYGPDLVEAQGSGYRPLFANEYVQVWLPALPDIQARLARGGRVCDVGCGVGWSAIAIADAYPAIAVDAVEPDARSAALARVNVAAAGLADRVRVHEAPVEEAELRGPYDLVTSFECLHDMPHPVRALRRMADLLAPDGAVLISDEHVGETIADNRTFVGRLIYNFSVLHCLPQSMAHEGSAATGAVIAPSTVRRYAAEAGLPLVEQLPINNDFFHFYRLGR